MPKSKPKPSYHLNETLIDNAKRNETSPEIPVEEIARYEIDNDMKEMQCQKEQDIRITKEEKQIKPAKINTNFKNKFANIETIIKKEKLKYKGKGPNIQSIKDEKIQVPKKSFIKVENKLKMEKNEPGRKLHLKTAFKDYQSIKEAERRSKMEKLNYKKQRIKVEEAKGRHFRGSSMIKQTMPMGKFQDIKREFNCPDLSCAGNKADDFNKDMIDSKVNVKKEVYIKEEDDNTYAN